MGIFLGSLAAAWFLSARLALPIWITGPSVGLVALVYRWLGDRIEFEEIGRRLGLFLWWCLNGIVAVALLAGITASEERVSLTMTYDWGTETYIDTQTVAFWGVPLLSPDLVLVEREFASPTEFEAVPQQVTEQYRIGAICEDGWRSQSTGSGTCSHHGGVDHWLYRERTRSVTVDVPIPPPAPPTGLKECSGSSFEADGDCGPTGVWRAPSGNWSPDQRTRLNEIAEYAHDEHP